MTGQTLTITTPLALNRTRSATLTAPWFVQKTEYNPAQATFQPLVNGEEAFGAVFDAIMAAKHSVDASALESGGDGQPSCHGHPPLRAAR